MTGVIHIAGTLVTINARMRQRCAWCGAVLIDYDLSRIAVPVGQSSEPASWPVGELVMVDGGTSYVVEFNHDDPLPNGACGKIDLVVTT